MPSQQLPFKASRRKFAFWVGLGLFGLSERLRAGVLDDLAAAAMHATESNETSESQATPEHWSAAENSLWKWFERENFIDNRWQLTGITTPINKQTGESYAGRSGYLDASLVPTELLAAGESSIAADTIYQPDGPDEGQPAAERRARHGRPPSKWLRSLNADELRIWLKRTQVPEAGVSGMTFWTHLTRDHSFDPDRIDGLTIEEQAKLHAAAHYGY